MKDKSPFCEGDRVIWDEQPDKTWHVHYRWNEEYVNIINKFKGGFTSIRVHVDKIKHANRKEELKQAIREVLLSDEFLTAFAKAWQKTPLIDSSELNLIVADDTRPYKSWNEIAEEAFQPIATVQVTSDATLEPAEAPKQPAEGYFDDTEGCWVDEKCPFDGRLNSDKIPEGYRKLGGSSKEPRQMGDLRWSVAEKRYVEMSVQEIGYANRDNWAACRKVEQEVKPPDGWRWLERGELIRKGDVPRNVSALSSHWIDTPCANNQFIMRRNRFEVGEKVVHINGINACEIVECDHEKDRYAITYNGNEYVYESKWLAPYIEDAK